MIPVSKDEAVRQFVKIFLLSTPFYGILMTLFFLWLFPRSYSLIIVTVPVATISFGVIFSAFVIWMRSSKKIKEATTPVFYQDERIVSEQLANHLRRYFAVGGRLYLTTERLVFRSHPFLQPSYEFEVLRKDVVNVYPYNIYGFVPTGLRLQIKSGKGEIFVVENRKAFLDIMRKTLNLN